MPDWNSDVIPTDATLRGEGFDQQQVRIVDINIENLHHRKQQDKDTVVDKRISP